MPETCQGDTTRPSRSDGSIDSPSASTGQARRTGGGDGNNGQVRRTWRRARSETRRRSGRSMGRQDSAFRAAAGSTSRARCHGRQPTSAAARIFGPQANIRAAVSPSVRHLPGRRSSSRSCWQRVGRLRRQACHTPIRPASRPRRRAYRSGSGRPEAACATAGRSLPNPIQNSRAGEAPQPRLRAPARWARSATPRRHRAESAAPRTPLAVPDAAAGSCADRPAAASGRTPRLRLWHHQPAWDWRG